MKRSRFTKEQTIAILRVHAAGVKPPPIVSDNGTELTGMAILRGSQETQIGWYYVAPGKPTQNALTSFKSYCVTSC